MKPKIINGNMAIVKLKREPRIPGKFTCVNYDLLWNPVLSSNQKIILITIFSFKSGYPFTKGTIQEITKIPSTTFDREWHKLIELGHISQENKGNRIWKTIYYEKSNGPKMGM